jgi:ubiquinone/menaquinone biosynthesis C-methylase UbiE
MFLRPGEIILHLREKKYLLPSMKGADFGCGSGYFTALLAKEVGANGKIYAIDIDDEALKSAQEFIDQLGFKNVKFLHQDLEVSTGLEQNLLDFVFISQVFYQSDEPQKIIKSAEESLKPNGYLIILEPQRGNPLFAGQKIYVPQEIVSLIEKENLQIVEIHQTNDYYLLICQK